MGIILSFIISKLNLFIKKLTPTSQYLLIISIFSYVKSNIYRLIDINERLLIIKSSLRKVKSYEEWKYLATEHDELTGKFKWKNKKETSLYNWDKVDSLVNGLILKRQNKDIKGLVHLIRSNIFRNMYSTTSPILYEISKVGTKHLIEVLQEEVLLSFDFISSSHDISLNNKIELFSELRHNYGNTALMLSGGASLGMYHLGVIKVLYELDLLPRILCGSSAGSIITALISTNKYEDIPNFLSKGLKLSPFEYKDKTKSIFSKLFRILTEGVLFDTFLFKEFLRENIGDFTFQEAYERTGFILNITVTGLNNHENDRLLNYLSAPNVVIWSAVAASCSVPMLFEPCGLLSKNENGVILPYDTSNTKYIDGSIGADIPIQRIGELFNVNNFIVSQTNPHVVPFISDNPGNTSIYNNETGRFNIIKKLKNLLYGEIRHRLIQLEELGFIPSFISSFIRLMNQNYYGNVTILPVPSIMDFLKVLKNPTKEMIEDCCIESERMTYKYVSQIEANLKIEFALENQLRRLKSRRKKGKVGKEGKCFESEHEGRRNGNEIFEKIDNFYDKFVFNYKKNCNISRRESLVGMMRKVNSSLKDLCLNDKDNYLSRRNFNEDVNGG